jgi:hypothetical protein
MFDVCEYDKQNDMYYKENHEVKILSVLDLI